MYAKHFVISTDACVVFHQSSTQYSNGSVRVVQDLLYSRLGLYASAWLCEGNKYTGQATNMLWFREQKCAWGMRGSGRRVISLQINYDQSHILIDIAPFPGGRYNKIIINSRTKCANSRVKSWTPQKKVRKFWNGRKSTITMTGNLRPNHRKVI